MYWYTIFHSIWWKDIFVIRFLKQHDLSPWRTVTLKKWRQDDTRTVYRNSQSLYHAASSMFFILQLKTAIYYLTSDLFVCLWESLVTYNFFLNFAIRYLLSFKILNIERIKIFTGWNKTLSVYFIIRIGLLGLIELVT